MATTLARSPLKPEGDARGLRLDPVGHRRRPALAVGSLALVIACVAAFTGLYARAGDLVSVIAVAHTVPQGATVTANDLTVVRMSATTGVASIRASDAAEVVGRRAAEQLEPGTLLATDELVTRFAPPSGKSIVGVAVKTGQIPASGVSPGETVDVIVTGLPEDSSAVASGQPDGDAATPTIDGESISSGTVIVPGATVVEVAPSPDSSDSGTTVVSLLIRSSLAPLVASASVAGQAALVIVTPGS